MNSWIISSSITSELFHPIKKLVKIIIKKNVSSLFRIFVKLRRVTTDTIHTVICHDNVRKTDISLIRSLDLSMQNKVHFEIWDSHLKLVIQMKMSIEL
jgi:hypothetical protein